MAKEHTTIGLVVVFALLFAVAGRAEDKARNGGKTPDYRELIKGLVSPNEPPEIYDEDQVKYPPHYDLSAQRRIGKNRRILYKQCGDALPFLIDACTDSRYSLTWKSDSYAGNECVGEVCLEIVASYLEVYRDHMPSLGSKTRYYAYRFVPRIGGTGQQVTDEKRKEIEQWWKARKGKSLFDLQMEAFDWAIAKRKAEADGDEEVKSLAAAREKLRQSRKPLPPQSISSSIPIEPN